MRRKQRINASRKPGESLKAAARRLLGEDEGETSRDAGYWLIGKHMALGRTHGESVLRVMREEI